VLLGPPAAQSDKDVIAERALERQQAFEDALIEWLPSMVDPLASHEPRRPSELDTILSAVLQEPVTLRGYTCTYIEKKDTRYPAIAFVTRDIVDTDGNQLQEIIALRLRDSDGRAALAEALGKRLGVEWARVVVTYGYGDYG